VSDGRQGKLILLTRCNYINKYINGKKERFDEGGAYSYQKHQAIFMRCGREEDKFHVFLTSELD